MKATLILVSLVATTAFAELNCLRIGRNIMDAIGECHQIQSFSPKYIFYDCDHGRVLIETRTGNMGLTIYPSDGHTLMLSTGRPHCTVERKDELGVVIMNEPTVNSDEGVLYKEFKAKYVTHK